MLLDQGNFRNMCHKLELFSGLTLIFEISVHLGDFSNSILAVSKV